ncbi:hypothetical protein [Acinetobacter sp. MD2(2019)]|uniref:hypothetical protein n=1 Tax=Acinetobacter sp. MD2(2019) TaxID=2605273 RepID=UPI002D1E555E|nr:hypothetical protein [Acinetobacter sp. MD2(2019)]MEB3754036.1 hypothetical protein [Acinetobacter sp. MD2(2019)]
MSHYTPHPHIEQLIELHLQFLEHEFHSDNIQSEYLHFFEWFKRQTLQDLWPVEHIQQLIQQQILNTPLSTFFTEQLATQLHFALSHSINDTTNIEDVADVMAIDELAQYISSKTEHRTKLVHHVVTQPAFHALISQLIQHALQDYLDHSMNKHVPHVGRFMKMGKSVLETVTDSRLDDTIANYLQKNILKLSQLSETVLNQHFDDEKLYHFQANLWHKIKTQPLSVLKNYIVLEDLPQIVQLTQQFWDYFRQSDYLKQQLHDGIYTWYIRNQNRTFAALLQDLNINQQILDHELQQLIQPLLLRLSTTGYLRQRADLLLRKFYYSAQVYNLLTQNPQP